MAKKRGRPSLYETRVQPRLEEIKAWCRDGYTDIIMCEALKVSIASFCKYKNDFPELKEALNVTKPIADLKVVNSLHKRALGYEYEEVTKEVKTDKAGAIISKHIKSVTKFLPGDVKAQEVWLRNRDPKNWNQKQGVELSGPDGKPVEVINHDMDPKEAAKIYSQMIKGDE
jgi:hypothetical protein